MEDLSFEVTSDYMDSHFCENSDYIERPSVGHLNKTAPALANSASTVASQTVKDAQGNFYDTALGILYTLTPAILILDSHRRVVFANREAEGLLEHGSVISKDGKGRIFCTDHVAQNYLLQYLMSHQMQGKTKFSDEDGSFLIPKADGWPMVAMVGCDQLDSLTFHEGDYAVNGHITLMIRDPHGRHPEQSKKLMEYFDLSGAESSVVGELVNGCSTDEIARQRGVSVITIRNQLKSAQNKMGVARQSELVSMVLRYIS